MVFCPRVHPALPCPARPRSTRTGDRKYSEAGPQTLAHDKSRKTLKSCQWDHKHSYCSMGGRENRERERERGLYTDRSHPCTRQTDIPSFHQEKKRNPPLPNRSAAMGGREFVTNPILTCVCGLVDQRFGGSAGRGAEQAGCVSRG